MVMVVVVVVVVVVMVMVVMVVIDGGDEGNGDDQQVSGGGVKGACRITAAHLQVESRACATSLDTEGRSNRAYTHATTATDASA
jgi:hypothetical protein